MRNHQGEELAVELCAICGCECVKLCLCGHALHHVMRMAGVPCGHFHGGRLAARGQPLLHEIDLVRLAGEDPPSYGDNTFVVGSISDQFGHGDRLLMVNNHHLHEGNIGVGVLCLGQLRCLFSGQRLARLTRSARLHNLLRESDGRGAEQHGGEKRARTVRNERV